MSAPRPRRLNLAVVGAALLLAIVGMQYMGGVYTAEFGGAADEAAHYVTGLMVREYIASGLPEAPMDFARRYYLSYPQVAMGHWPPFFYMVQAAWTLVATPSRTSVLLLIACLGALLSLTLYRTVETLSGSLAAALTTLAFVLLPVRQALGGMIMAETLLTLLGFWAGLQWAAFLAGGRWRHALGFAVAASLAIMTKGNGWALLLVPPLTVLVGRRFDVLRARAAWLSIGLVLAVCVPWHLWTMGMVQNGWEYPPGIGFLRAAVPFNLRAMVACLGPGLCLAAAAGVIGVLRCSRANVELWLTAACGAAGVFIFHCAVPASLDRRHLLPAVPFVLLFVWPGVELLARIVPGRCPGRWKIAAVVLLLAGLFAWQPAGLYRKPHYGIREAVEDLRAAPASGVPVYLISSEKYGEGLLVAEVAMRDPRPKGFVLRASKLLSVSSWSGAGYRCLFQSAGEVLDYIRSIPVEVVVLDFTPSRRTFQHQAQLVRAIQDHPELWRLAGTYPASAGSRGPIKVYRRILSISDKSDGLPTPVRQTLEGRIGRE